MTKQLNDDIDDEIKENNDILEKIDDVFDNIGISLFEFKLHSTFINKLKYDWALIKVIIKSF